MRSSDFPPGISDERELLLSWLAYLRGAVVRNLDGLGDDDARWTPDGALISVLGVVNHLTHVEWRWINGGMLGEPVSRSEDEFTPGRRARPRRPRSRPTAPGDRHRRRRYARCRSTRRADRQAGTDLRWVLLHLINETARHAGHADATRELLDGTTGE